MVFFPIEMLEQQASFIGCELIRKATITVVPNGFAVLRIEWKVADPDLLLVS